MEAQKNNRAVFIDRDDTIAKDVPYCSRPEDFHLLPGVSESIRILNELGFKVVVITNQSGISRGYFSEDDLSRIHKKMVKDLNEQGATIDGIYYCPHHPDENCDCRKPKPKLIHLAAADLDIDVGRSYMVGDKDLDIEMAASAGCKEGILITNENHAEITSARSFKEAVKKIIDIEKNTYQI